MHTLALQLAPILGAEKSKVPFFIAGGLLAIWALVVSLGLGLRRPDFPGDQAKERLVIAISVVLVLAAVSTAVLTSSAPAPAKASGGASPAAAPGESAAAPAAVPSTTSSSPPTATTGSPGAPASPAKGGVASTLKLAASPGGQLAFEAKQLSAKAGSVTIDFTNTSPLGHNVAVAQGATVLGSTPTFSGGTKALTLTLKPGSYVFFCTVPGHRQAGMEGTLKVS
jgi:plastocyanin